MAKNLHEALFDLGITSKPSPIPGKRTLIQFGKEVGDFDAHEGWELVFDLSGPAVECPHPTTEE